MSRRVLWFSLFISGILTLSSVILWLLLPIGGTGSFKEMLRKEYGIVLLGAEAYSFEFTPLPALRIEKASLFMNEENANIALENSKITGSLKLIPLIFKRLELNNVSFYGGKLSVYISKAPLKSINKKTEIKRSLFKRFTISNTLIELKSDFLAPLSFPNSSLQSQWLMDDKEISFKGTTIWRDVPVSISKLSLQLKSKTPSMERRFSFSGSSDKAKLVIDGILDKTDALSGTLAFESSEFVAFKHWVGITFPLTIEPSNFSFKSSFSMSEGRFVTPDIVITAGKNFFEGTLMLFFNQERLALNATLASEILDLTPYQILLTVFETHTSSAPKLVGKPISLLPFTKSDVDLRLSANTVLLGATKLHDMAANVLIREGRAELSIARAIIEEGSLKGKLGLTESCLPYLGNNDVVKLDDHLDVTETASSCQKSESGLQLRLTGILEGIDLAPIYRIFSLEPFWPTVPEHLQFSLESAGQSREQLISQIYGEGHVRFQKTELKGINLEAVFEDSKKDFEVFDQRKKTDISELKADFLVTSGYLQFLNGLLKTKTTKTIFGGGCFLKKSLLFFQGYHERTDKTSQALSLFLHGYLIKPELLVQPIVPGGNPMIDLLPALQKLKNIKLKNIFRNPMLSSEHIKK